MLPTLDSRTALAGVSLVMALCVSACGDDGDDAVAEPTGAAPTATAATTTGGAGTISAGSSAGTASTADGLPSDHLGSYELVDEAFGTTVTVTVEGSTRTLETNALPDHETGEFPNPGNPNAISAQDLTWQFPTEGTYTGAAADVRTTGVAVNGVKFEPGTAETVDCASGESYRVEALQDLFDLGFDLNNAHVQPSGEYHYHGVSELLVDAYDSDDDLVHIGFAADGFLIYYSKSGAYEPGYVLDTTPRTGTDCTISLPGGEAFDLDGTTPDGTYTSDWAFDEANGDLDSCNGTTIDGQYVYLITDAYPFIPRCLNGEFTEVGGPGAGGPPDGATPRDG